jgi:ClpP class serine protease
VDDSDKNSLMATIHQLDRSVGLDLILHTPGGDTAATESIVDYLRAMFPDDMRAIVPQLAMSPGTMTACAANSIVLGKQSSLGPIDPQIGGVSAHAIIDEFKQAKDEIRKTPVYAPIWQPIIAKYQPTLIIECQNAMKWSENMVGSWIKQWMFSGQGDAEERASRVVQYLVDHNQTGTHSRHISIAKAKEIGLIVETLEDNQDLQEAVLSVHHACMQSLALTDTLKLVSNQDGITAATYGVF